jgi:hypothetical protein
MATALALVSEALIEKYRECNVDYCDWYDDVYQAFIEDMKAIGVRVDNIYFSGFWSQGDGACFEGRVEDSETFLNNFQGYPMMNNLVRNGGSISLKIEHRGHYYHSNSICWEYEVEPFWQVVSAPTEFHENIIRIMDEELDKEVGKFEAEAIEFLKDSMGELYSRLSDTYDYLVSNEAVAETIVANDWHINNDDNEE